MEALVIKPRKIYREDLALGNGTDAVEVMGIGTATLTQIDLASAVRPNANKGNLSGTKNGTNKVFTIPTIHAGNYLTLITVNGSIQDATTNYTLAGTNVTFVSAPVSSDRLGFIDFYSN